MSERDMPERSIGDDVRIEVTTFDLRSVHAKVAFIEQWREVIVSADFDAA
ncbi:MAG: hypothetical protein P4L71_20195 [Acetobacteraceae bacterium]|nr:hypothetical protein [Acetobacteraceae bacterium]